MHQPSGGKSAGSKYRTYSWIEYRDAAQQIACGLRQLGIGKGDIVALHAEASAAFYMADFGIVSNGSIAAALYTSLPPSDHLPTVAAAQPRTLIVEDPATLRSLRKAGVVAPLWILLSVKSRASSHWTSSDAKGAPQWLRTPAVLSASAAK